MTYSLTTQGERAQHCWSSRKVIIINAGLDSARISIADADNKLGAIRGLVWAIVFELSIAILIFLCLEL
jgi:hypothetical protein